MSDKNLQFPGEAEKVFGPRVDMCSQLVSLGVQNKKESHRRNSRAPIGSNAPTTLLSVIYEILVLGLASAMKLILSRGKRLRGGSLFGCGDSNAGRPVTVDTTSDGTACSIPERSH